MTARRLARVLAVLAVGACSSAPTAGRAVDPAARDAVVHAGTIADRVLLTGALAPGATNAVDLKVPRVDDGVGIRFLVEDGATVKAGDRVAELDNSALTQGLEQKHIAALEADTTWRNTDDLAGISLADKQNELRQRELELEKAQLAASVPADLMSSHDAQQKQLEMHRAETAVAKAKRDLEAERDSDELERHVKALERDRTKTAVDTVEQTIADLVIRAPKDGVVVLGDQPWEGRKFQVGDTVWNGLTIASMPDLAQALEVHADLSDVDDGRIAVGMTGTCTLDAYPDVAVPCTVRDVTPVAREVSKNSVRHAFAVVLELAHADTAHQRPGLSVKVELARPAITGVVVPRGAIVFGAPAHVRMASGELREVAITGCGAQACAVATGVQDGEAVRP